MSFVPDLKPDDIDLKQPDRSINRDLGLLEYHRYVLEQARDERTPLLERLRLLCISNAKLDKFFETRVARRKQAADLGAIQTGTDKLTPREALRVISIKTHELVQAQYRAINEVLIPELAGENIHIIRRGQWNAAQDAWLRGYFKEALLPVLSPLSLGPAHPFPRILNKSLNFILTLKGMDAFGRRGGVAVVQAPRFLPRLIQLPPEVKGSGPHDFVFLSSIIHAYVDGLFHGLTVTGCYPFRVTRNSGRHIDEEEIDHLLRIKKGALTLWRHGAVVRLDVAHDCAEDAMRFLVNQFKVGHEELYRVNGPVNLNCLSAVCDAVDRPDLKVSPPIHQPFPQDS